MGSIFRNLVTDSNSITEISEYISTSPSQRIKDSTVPEAAESVVKIANYLLTGSLTDASTVEYDEINEEGVKETKTKTVYKRFNKNLGDAFSARELRDLVPLAVQYIMREEIMPKTPITSFFDKVSYNGATESFVIQDFGPIEVARVASSENYPQANITIGSETSERVNIDVTRYGIEFSMDKDFTSHPYSATYTGLIFRKIANAFAVRKEANAIKCMSNMGRVVFYDNATGNGVCGHGRTTGRERGGSFNWTVTPYDLMDVYTTGLTKYNMKYDTIIMHPFAWKTFMFNPAMREFLTGDSKVKFPSYPTGNVDQGWPQYKPNPMLYPQQGTFGNPDYSFSLNMAQKLGVNPTSVDPSVWGAEWTLSPNNGFSNEVLKVVLCPEVKYVEQTSAGIGTGTYITDLIFLSSGNVGGLFQAQELQTREKGRESEFYNTITYRFDEIYAFAPYYRGEGMGIIKNVAIDRSYDFDNVNSVALTGSYPTGNISLS